MAETQKRVRFWRGTLESYNTLKNLGALDYWTRYSVKVPSGTGFVWKEFFGDNPLSEESGQLLPVIDIVEKLPTTLNPGDRYWVTSNGENYIVEITVGPENVLDGRIIELKEGISVRVKSRDYMAYVLVDALPKTYDEVDCGEYDNSVA